MKAKFPFFAVLPCLLIALSACSFTKSPQKSWTEENCPLQPDYSKLDSWAAHPDKADFADKTPVRRYQDAQKDAEVDVFFLHPTTLFGHTQWNGDPTDAKLNRRTEKTTIKHQASIFNGVGRIYAPRYRQMLLGGFFDKHDLASNRRAYHTAYTDLKASFEYYLEHLNQGRPIIIASHSQGSAHAIHLLQDFFDDKPLQSQLVAAYIPGWPVPADTFKVLQPCTSASQTGCYASWCSFEAGTSPKSPAWYDDAVVTNPVTWRMDTVRSAFADHLGTVLASYDTIFSKVVQAQAHDGYLWVTRPDVKGTGVIRGNNYHIADFNIFWADVRENAMQRAQQFLREEHAGR